jgi:putative tributyrin esterase
VSTIATMEFPSAALGRQVTFSVILPEAGDGPFPVVYQLHGASDDHRAWLQRSNLVRHASGLPLIVVLPDGGLSFWADVHPLLRYETFVIDDLDRHVRRTFPVRTGPAAIGGLSMGGYGAIRLALRHPERFSSVFAHSSRVPTRAELRNLAWARGADLDELDLEVIIERADPARAPRISLDCGLADHLLGDSRRLHALLDRRGIVHDYAEYEGAHTWDYWDAHVPEALRQHCRVLLGEDAA